jgi:Holliday junction resolvase RusA-like endonuclease
MMKLIIPGTLPNLNDYIDAERKHRQKAAAMKKKYEHLIMLLAKSQLRGVKFTKPVVMRYVWLEPNRRRDKDNVSSFGRKLIQDALVRSGVLKNDGWNEIDSFSDSFGVDQKNPRIEITITEAQL